MPGDVRAVPDKGEWYKTACGACGGGDVIRCGDYGPCHACDGDGYIEHDEAYRDGVRVWMVELMSGHKLTVQELDAAFRERGS